MPVIPRVILELESLAECAYDLRYHAKLQGFVYSLLEGMEYEYLHNKEGCKNFCFSNINPPFDMQKGDRRCLHISSPDPMLVTAFASSLGEIETANIGDMSFSIERMRIVNLQNQTIVGLTFYLYFSILKLRSLPLLSLH